MKAFLKSFVYAFNGIFSAIRTQRNLRFHIVAVIYVTAFSFFYNMSEIQYLILILIFLIVISLELVNTALESIVDLCSPEYNKLAKISKDCAASAVLVAAAGAVIAGIILFADFEVFKIILNYYRDNFWALIGLIVFTVLSIVFVFYPSDTRKGKD